MHHKPEAVRKLRKINAEQCQKPKSQLEGRSMDLGRKIPFAIRQRDGRIVSIDDVITSGLACKCICPACQAVLVAKKGPDKAHHFAHHEKSEELCQYAAFTSIRLMLLDIFSSDLSSQPTTIELPNKTIEMTIYTNEHKKFSDSINISKPCPPVFASLHNRYKPPQLLLTFSSLAEVECPDVCIAVHLPPANQNLDEMDWLNAYTEQWPKRGVLDINYAAILSMLWSKTEFSKETPITDRLLKIFFTKPYVFRWLYHPSEQIELKKLNANLMKKKEIWEHHQSLKMIVKKTSYLEEINRIEEMAKLAPSFYEMYERDSSLEKKSFPTTFEEPRMSIEDVIQLINSTGIQPTGVSSLHPVYELEVSDGWIVAEIDNIWFISAIKPADWKTANILYSAGMRKGVCVNRNEVLEKALKLI